MNKSRTLAASVAVLALGIGVAACGDDDTTSTTIPPAGAVVSNLEAMVSTPAGS